MTGNKPQQHSVARACTACYRKKIRCNVASGKVPCSSCELHGLACIPRSRKRKHDPVPAETSPPVISLAYSSGDIRAAPTKSRERRGCQLETSRPQSQSEPETLHTAPDPPQASAEVDYEDYYGSSLPGHQVTDGAHHGHSTETPTTANDRAILQMSNCCNLPSAAWQSALIENFFVYAAPLMPIVDQQWLVSRPDYNAPPVLIRAGLEAGARVSEKQPLFSCDEYYSAIKAVLLYSREQNPIISVIVACILGWYNQASTYTVTVDSSAAWLRFAASIAYQIGLHKEPNSQDNAAYRRKLWWTLIARDCQISTGQGRPRIFNLLDCTVKPISAQDFTAMDTNSDIFIAHVRLCIILGDLCDSHRRRELNDSARETTKHRLFWWLKSLPPNVHSSMTQPSPSNFVWRQLFVIYFAAVTILYRTEWSTGKVHSQALIASSFLTSSLEGFMARDEMQRLPTMFGFYSYCAAVPQMVAIKLGMLRAPGEQNLEIIEEALRALAARWPSIKSALEHFHALKAAPPSSAMIQQQNDLLLFETFDLIDCNVWSILVSHNRHDESASTQQSDGVHTMHFADRASSFEDASVAKPPAMAGHHPQDGQHLYPSVGQDPFDSLSAFYSTDVSGITGSWLVFEDPSWSEAPLLDQGGL